MKKSSFPILISYLKNINSRYFRAFTAFHVFETLEEALAVNVVGKEKAEQNLQTIKMFHNFFIISKESLRVYFFLELSKLFDSSNNSLQINKIINIAERNLSKITVSDFEEFNKDREYVSELVRGYKGMTRDNLNEIKNILKKEKSVIDKLKIYRDKWLAHDDLSKPELPSISSDEIRSLFYSFAELMNIFTKNLNHESTMWEHLEESSKSDTKNVLDHLYRFEKYRFQELQNEVDIYLESLKNQGLE